MPILTIRHVTTYHYKQPVAFGEHRMMLRPRDDDDQTVLESELEITPSPSEISWTRDRFGNHVATARFASAPASFASKAPSGSTTCRPHSAPPISRILPVSIRLPMRRKSGPRLARFMAPRSPHAKSIAGPRASCARTDRADTHELLVDMTRTIRRTSSTRRDTRRASRTRRGR